MDSDKRREHIVAIQAQANQPGAGKWPDLEHQRPATIKNSSIYDNGAPLKQSGTRKIADLKPTCNHPNHNPASMMVFPDGVYEHVCPGCGNVQHFTVRNSTI